VRRLGKSFLVTIIYSFTLSSTYSAIPKIRVLVAKSLKKVVIKGENIQRTFHFNNETAFFPGSKRVKFNCDKLKGRMNFDKPLMLASLKTDSGKVFVDKSEYKGDLHIVTSKDQSLCDVIQESSIDDYLSALLSKEMNSTWPIEALKAQAVAARTYALHKIRSKQVSNHLGYQTHYDLENSEKHQVSGDFSDVTESTRRATTMTTGHVLVNSKGEMSPLFFHAKCGGRTLLPEQVWLNQVEGYTSVNCPRCDGKDKSFFSKTIGKKRIVKFLKWAMKRGYIKKKLKTYRSKISFLKDYKYSRILRLYVGNSSVVLSKSLLRRYFGRVLFPSNNFKVVYNDRKSSLKIKGKGYGHGVGMCQVGALDLAKKGWSYQKILSHYFPQHKLIKIY